MSDTEEISVEVHREENTEEDTLENAEELEVNTKEKDLKLKRKIIKGKITRTINRIKEGVKSKELTKRRADKVLKDLKEDFKVALNYHGELYVFPGVDTDKLDRWEEDVTRDVYGIEEKVEDYFTVPPDSRGARRRSTSRKRTENSAIEEEVRETDVSELEEIGSGTVMRKDKTEHSVEIDKTIPERESRSHDKVPDDSGNSKVTAPSPSVIKCVDAWIDELKEFEETKLPEIDEIEEMSIATALFRIEARKDVPPVELPKFSGDPLDYVEFIEAFKIHVHEKATLRDDQRIGHLKTALRGKAEESIKGLGSSGIMYATALKSIKREFGQSSLIVRAQINKITRGDAIRPNDRDSLRTFSLDIINCIATLKRLDRLSDANAPEFLRQVVRKLPVYLVDRWKTRAMEIRDRGGYPNLQEISTFIQRNVRAQFDPDYGDLFRDSRPVQIKRGVNANTPTSNTQFTRACKVCGQTDHSHVKYCSKFKSLSVEERFKSAKEQRLCYSCLMYGHRTRDCRNKKSCGVNNCPRTHNSLLHVDAPVASGTSALDRDSMLPVVRVRFRADNGKVREGNVLIDSGAGTTIIRKEFAKMLGLQGKKEGLNISVVGGRNQQQRDSRRVNFWISPLDGVEEYRVEAHELDKTIAEVGPIDKRWLSSFNHLKDVRFTHREGQVDLILGVQYTHLHVEQEIREGLAFEPVAKSTRLGWVVIGSEYRNSHTPPIATIAFCMNSMQEDVRLLYEVETVGVQAVDCKCPKMSPEDKKVLDFFESSFKIENMRCTVGLPWARDPSELPNNYEYAKRRLCSLEQSLERNQAKKEAYRKVMDDYVQNGWAEEVTNSSTDNVFYLPHHGVINMDKPSTPLRVVFDSAALYQGASLNQFLHKGPSTLIDLFGILIRFREDYVGFMGDISKMFLQICLPEADTQYHRYLWRDTNSTREPSIYRLLRVTFGDKPSPEMANFVMRKLAELNEEDYSQAADILKRDRYMDDLIHSCKSSNEAEKKMSKLDEILAQGSFNVKEWHSSKKKSDQKVDITGDKRVKTLGVVWCCEKDTFHFNVKSLLETEDTKRSVPSKLSMLFDPLGPASVVTIRARIAMQEIWKLKDVGWDDPLPNKMCILWSEIFKDLEELNSVKIDRCLKPLNAISSPELHVFADASNVAYGACAYLLWPTATENSVKLVAAKSRVAPLHQTTIPRLELMAALLAARLANTLCCEMKNKPEVLLWTDSKVVLKWIQSESTTKKPFVAVRIAEIQTTWNPDQWRYVPSKENVADDLSRGLKASQISDRWFGGPEFLKLPKEKWPAQETLEEIEDNKEEKKSKVNCSGVQRKPLSGDMIIDCERYSSWRKLLRITAYCFRFMQNLKNRIDGGKKTTEIANLQPEELQGAESVGEEGGDSPGGQQTETEKRGREDIKSTYVHLMQELEGERERRWKAEQAAKKLADHIRSVQTKAKEDSETKTTALEATGHLKKVLMNEREAKIRLQEENQDLKDRISEMTEALSRLKESENNQKMAVQSLEDAVRKQERERVQQQTHEMKKLQETQMKAAAMTREAEMLRHTTESQKGQLNQLRELLATREQEHRSELKQHYSLGSPELQQLIQQEAQRVSARHEQELQSYTEKIDVLTSQYSDLEDEFRLALQIEANRFSELQREFERTARENAECQQKLTAVLKKEERSAGIITELTAMVKEQKGRITELSKSKQEQNVDFRERVSNLEAHVEEARKRMVQLELLKKEKTRLTAEVQAQESVIQGLKAERKLWGQELAQQGASLAQDRGRLESKIEILTQENNSLKKQLERETDGLKIKSKVIDDQTETIRRLKEGVLDRDNEIKKAREDALKTQQDLEAQLLEERTANQDTQEEVERLQERKEELKQQLACLREELEQSQNAHSVLSKRWKEKSSLIGQLEQQVQQMKESWEGKERTLTQERNKAIQAADLAIEKLRGMDDGFRKQLESKEQSHREEMALLHAQKQQELAEANRRVELVEEEMRTLLRETESNKKKMEDKVRHMTQALGEIQSNLF